MANFILSNVFFDIINFFYHKQVPLCIRWLIAFLLDCFNLSPQLATVLRSGVRTPLDVCQAKMELDEYVQQVGFWLMKYFIFLQILNLKIQEKIN